MNTAQKLTVLAAWVTLLLINLADAFPRGDSGGYRVVGEDTISVSVPETVVSKLTVPVIDSYSFKSPVETGQRVAVYLRNDYCDAAIQRAPKLTVFLLLGFAFVYGTVTHMTKKVLRGAASPSNNA